MKFNYMKIIRSRFKFLLTFLFLGIIIGIVVYLKCSQDIKSNIDLTLATMINNIILSSFIVGFIPLTIYYIYEGASIGFLFSALLHYKNIKGIYYFLVFTITNKLIYLILLSYIFYLTYKYIKIFINNHYKIVNLNGYMLRTSITLLIILLNDIFLYYYGNKIIAIFI